MEAMTAESMVPQGAGLLPHWLIHSLTPKRAPCSDGPPPFIHSSMCSMCIVGRTSMLRLVTNHRTGSMSSRTCGLGSDVLSVRDSVRIPSASN